VADEDSAASAALLAAVVARGRRAAEGRFAALAQPWRERLLPAAAAELAALLEKLQASLGSCDTGCACSSSGGRLPALALPWEAREAVAALVCEIGLWRTLCLAVSRCCRFAPPNG